MLPPSLVEDDCVETEAYTPLKLPGDAVCADSVHGEPAQQSILASLPEDVSSLPLSPPRPDLAEAGEEGLYVSAQELKHLQLSMSQLRRAAADRESEACSLRKNLADAELRLRTLAPRSDSSANQRGAEWLRERQVMASSGASKECNIAASQMSTRRSTPQAGARLLSCPSLESRSTLQILPGTPGRTSGRVSKRARRSSHIPVWPSSVVSSPAYHKPRGRRQSIL